MLALLGQALPVVLVGVLLLNLLQRGLTRPGGTGDPHPPSAPRPRTPAGSAQRPPTAPRPTPRSPTDASSPTAAPYPSNQPVPTLPEPAAPSSTTTPLNQVDPAPPQAFSHEVVPAEASAAGAPADPPPPGAATVPAKPPPTPATAVPPIATDRTSPPADANVPSPPQNSTARPASTPRSLAGGGSPPAPPQAFSHEVVAAEASEARGPADPPPPATAHGSSQQAPPPPGTPAPCSPVVPAPGQRTTASPESAVPSAVAALHAARRVATLIAAGVVLALWCAVLLLQRFQAPDWTAILLLPAAGGAVYALRARLGVFPLHCRRCGRRLPLGVTLGFDATATARYETAACPHPACGVQAPPPAPL